MEIRNTGFIYSPPPEKQWIFGGVSGISENGILREDGQWLDFLPVFESQVNLYVDAMNCVTMSADNSLEVLGRLKGVDINIADRFVAKTSGTTKKGNTFYNVWESLSIKNGVVPEARWPFDPTIKTWEEYYSEIPEEILQEGKKSLESFKVRYQYVTDNADSLCEALRCGPLQVAIYAYPSRDKDGIFVRSTRQGNHAVLLIGYKYKKFWYIFDSYAEDAQLNGKIKKLAWDTEFWGAILPTIISLKPNSTVMKIEEKIIYQLVDGHGGFFSRIGDNIYKLTSAEDFEAIRLRFPTVTVQSSSGSAEIQVPKYKTITSKELSGIAYKNMKGEIIGEFASMEEEDIIQ